jgi:hypothetical protein
VDDFDVEVEQLAGLLRMMSPEEAVLVFVVAHGCRLPEGLLSRAYELRELRRAARAADGLLEGRPS